MPECLSAEVPNCCIAELPKCPIAQSDRSTPFWKNKSLTSQLRSHRHFNPGRFYWVMMVDGKQREKAFFAPQRFRQKFKIFQRKINFSGNRQQILFWWPWVSFCDSKLEWFQLEQDVVRLRPLHWWCTSWSITVFMTDRAHQRWEVANLSLLAKTPVLPSTNV